MYKVYADGSCLKNPGGATGWGVVVVAPDGTEKEFSSYAGLGTNQTAELTAAIEGVSKVPKGSVLELVSDSQYVLKGISEWRKGWEKRGWKNSKNEPVANESLWRKLFSLVDERKVSVRWVRGHNGDVMNERCDKLALAAAMSK